MTGNADMLQVLRGTCEAKGMEHCVPHTQSQTKLGVCQDQSVSMYLIVQGESGTE